MGDILFEYTARSIHAAQGSGPSTEEGYDIWMKHEDDWVFLGFCRLYEIEKNMKFYRDQGDRVYIRRQPSDDS